MYYKTMLSILAKALIISFQYNIESVYFFYSNPVFLFILEWGYYYSCDVPQITVENHNKQTV